MVTKEQAVAAGAQWGAQHFHYTGLHECTRIVGPRGGVKVNITDVRTSGKCQVWKTRPAEFRLPVKYGMYEHFQIDQNNNGDFHLPEDCPIRETGS